MMKNLLLVFFFYLSIACYSQQTSIADSLRNIADKVNSEADQLKPKATELEQLFAGYKARAKKCNKALNEAEKGYDMAKEASKDLETAKKIAAKAVKAKKPEDGIKQIKIAQQKVHQAKYFIKESEDRKKETEFELRGCK